MAGFVHSPRRKKSFGRMSPNNPRQCRLSQAYLPIFLGTRPERAYADRMAHLQESASMERTDWADCPLVEVIAGKVSGVPLLKGTRLPADTVLSNYRAGSPIDEIADNFDVPEQTVRDLLGYAARKQKHLEP